MCSTEELRSRGEGPKRRKPLAATPTDDGPLEKHTLRTQPMMFHAAVQVQLTQRTSPGPGRPWELYRPSKLARSSIAHSGHRWTASCAVCVSPAYGTNCGRPPAETAPVPGCQWRPLPVGLKLQHNETLQRLERRRPSLKLAGPPPPTQLSGLLCGGVGAHDAAMGIAGNRRSGRMSGNGR